MPCITLESGGVEDWRWAWKADEFGEQMVDGRTRGVIQCILPRNFQDTRRSPLEKYRARLLALPRWEDLFLSLYLAFFGT